MGGPAARSPIAISARIRWAAVIGWPVEHSKSPALHNAAFAAAGVDAVYLALPVAPDRLTDAMAGFRASPPLGLSVTVPHKQALLDLVDHVDPVAAAIGAINCVVFEGGGRVVGYNTDATGYTDGLRDDLGFDPGGCRALLLGGGGAARAVAAGLREAGVEDIDVVARSPHKVEWAQAQAWTGAALAERLPRTDLLVDCTSTGLSETAEADLPAPIDVAALPSSAVVSSLVYHRSPALVRRASDRGLRTQLGGPMLLHQGARAFSLWTGKAAPLAAMKTALGLR